MLERLKLQPDARVKFLQGFLRNPQRVGSIIPSSRFLERRLVQCAGIDHAATVVELGPGTGGTTRALLRAMKPDSNLLSIELHPTFARLLAEKNTDPRLHVYEGSAENVQAAIDQFDLPAPDVVVSGIPFSTMPEEVGVGILRSVKETLAPGGCFVAYQVRDRVAVLGRRVFGPPERDIELRNIPPMRFYRWQKPLAGAATSRAS